MTRRKLTDEERAEVEEAMNGHLLHLELALANWDQEARAGRLGEAYVEQFRARLRNRIWTARVARDVLRSRR